MSLAERGLRALVATGLKVGLHRNGREIKSAGYLRQAPDRWNLTTERRDNTDVSSAVAEVRFGPFSEAAEYDTVVVYDGNEIVREISTDVARVPAMGAFLTTVTLESSDG